MQNFKIKKKKLSLGMDVHTVLFLNPLMEVFI